MAERPASQLPSLELTVRQSPALGAPPTSSEAPLLAVRGISKHFGGVRALDDIALEVRAGEVHALVGENGAGKSTLNQIVTGVYPPDAGSIQVRGKSVRFRSPADAQRQGIAAVYQELSLIEELDVASNVFLHREPVRWGTFVDRARLYRECDNLLTALGIHSINSRAAVASLGVADRQLVELARAISWEAALIIMDEPTSALGADDEERLFRILADLRQRGASVLYVSHRLNEVFRAADRVTVLRDGRLVATKPVSETSQDDLIRLMVGRDVGHDLFPSRGASPPHADPTLEVQGLGREGLFDDVSLAVHSGEIVGLAGLVGAGRTSLLRAVFGAAPASTGTIHIEGVKVRIRKPRDAIERGIAMIPEDRRLESLALQLNIVENATSVRLPSFAGIVNRRRARELTSSAASEVGLEGRLERAVSELSGGNQQKVSLAKWLSIRPRVLLCDEPTRGIDVGAKAEIYALLRTLADEGAAILFASSELPEVLGLADRILVMCEGRLVAEFDARHADELAVLRAATGVGGDTRR